MKNKTKTLPSQKFQKNILERDKVDCLSQIHDRSHSCLCTVTSIKKSGGVKLVLWAQTFGVIMPSCVFLMWRLFWAQAFGVIMPSCVFLMWRLFWAQTFGLIMPSSVFLMWRLFQKRVVCTKIYIYVFIAAISSNVMIYQT